jgi:hypothetical protein
MTGVRGVAISSTSRTSLSLIPRRRLRAGWAGGRLRPAMDARALMRPDNVRKAIEVPRLELASCGVEGHDIRR